MKKLENIFFVISAVLFVIGGLAGSQIIINLSLLAMALAAVTYFLSLFLGKWSPKGGQSPVFVDSPERLQFLVDKEEFLKQLESDPNFNNEGVAVIIDPNGNGPCQSRSLTVKDLYEEVRKESKLGIKFTKLFAKDRDGAWDRDKTDIKEEESNSGESFWRLRYGAGLKPTTANKADNPWAQCVEVDYDKYLVMRDKCIADLRELPDKDTPQIMGMGGSWSPRDLAQQIEDQTTVGKKYVEMMVRAEEDDDEEDPNDT